MRPKINLLQKKYYLPILTGLFIILSACSQKKNFLDQNLSSSKDPLDFVQIMTDSIYDSEQVISMLLLPKDYAGEFDVGFSYSHKDLLPTSYFARNKDALAAINGGFFNMDSGGCVTYFEIHDTIISRKRDPDLKWGIADSLMNGAIIITNDSEILIQEVKSEQFYESSTQESAVLVTGPLLLLNSELVKLANTKFVSQRHPRTCLGIGAESIVFVTVDGRKKDAEGMSLHELQSFLLSIGCTDAINLDGGGSTTMWIKDKGIVNFPSDISGERPVSNALVITDTK